MALVRIAEARVTPDEVWDVKTSTVLPESDSPKLDNQNGPISINRLELYTRKEIKVIPEQLDCLIGRVSWANWVVVQ